MKRLITLIILLFISCYAQSQSVKTGITGENAVIIKENTPTRFVIKNDLADISFTNLATDKGAFTRIDIAQYSYGNEIGSPRLPVMRKLIEVPVGASIVVTIKNAEFKTYYLNDLGCKGKIIPVQPPQSKNDVNAPELIINPNAYAANEFIALPLVNAEQLGEMRGVKLARLNIAPVQYNPVTNTIKVYTHIEAEVSFENADLSATKALKEKNYSPYFNSFELTLLNYQSGGGTKDALSTYPVKYVIVSNPMFQTTLQPFVQWKTKKGFKVIEAYTNNPAVGTTTTSIKAYLQSLYNAGTANNPAPTYVLFVGDVAQLPTFAGTTGNHATDLKYCEFTGDFFPEMYYGRFSATTTAQLQAQINKTLEYEQYLMPNKTFLNNIVMIAGVDNDNAPTYGNGQVNYATNTYFNTINGFNCISYLYPASAAYAAQIIQNVSEGVGFANYTAHGSSSGWADPSFSVSDIAGLQNSGKYPLMVGNCCVTNKFDEAECFGEALLRASNKGAIGYIGASDNSYWDEDFWWACGVGSISANPTYATTSLGALDRIMHTHSEPFSQWYVSQGQMVNAGNLAVTQGSASFYNYYWEIYHLMGDPSLMPYFKIPQVMTANYLPLVPLGFTTFAVNTEPYAYVAVSSNGVLHGAALADSTGLANVNIIPFTTNGNADIVITKQNRQPIITTIPITTPSGPFVFLNNYQLTDVLGNNNGIVDYNETVKLNINLKNIGIADDTNVTAKLTSSDPYIAITDSTESYGLITAGNTKNINDVFSFKIANYIPDQHLANFNIIITDNNSNTWNYTINVVLNAPVLKVISMTIEDNTPANHNGKLDPGETATVRFKVQNSGHANTSNVVINISSLNNFISIPVTTSNLTSIAKGSVSDVLYTVTANAAVLNGANFNLVLDVITNPYSVQDTFKSMIGIMVEDFETNNFTRYNWDTTMSYAWKIIDTGAYEGTYCAKSATINNSQSSTLSIALNVLGNDSISFYRKVSSEEDWDFLNFTIDGKVIGRWSGNMDWERQSYAVNSGNHIFSWVYAKDVNTTLGNDCAWVDFITLPAIYTTIGVGINDIAAVKSCQMQLSPNPASSSFKIFYSIAEKTNISIRIYKADAQLIYKSDNKKQAAGSYTLDYNASLLGKGVYFISLQTDKQIITRKIIIAE